MKTTTLPAICSIALVAMLAAGASHWWSVHQFITMLDQGMPVPASHEMQAPAKAPAPLMANNTRPSTTTPTTNEAPSTQQKAFYEALIDKLTRVEKQNRDLLDQLAETNRDLMKLEFRVDTHSESFRPLPVSEDKAFSSINESIGVLPPRAEPVELPSHN